MRHIDNREADCRKLFKNACNLKGFYPSPNRRSYIIRTVCVYSIDSPSAEIMQKDLKYFKKLQAENVLPADGEKYLANIIKILERLLHIRPDKQQWKIIK